MVVVVIIAVFLGDYWASLQAESKDANGGDCAEIKSKIFKPHFLDPETWVHDGSSFVANLKEFHRKANHVDLYGPCHYWLSEDTEGYYSIGGKSNGAGLERVISRNGITALRQGIYSEIVDRE